MVTNPGCLRLTICLSFWLTFSCRVVAQADALPSVAVAGQGALVSSEQVFDIVNKPTKECHATTIVETPAGMVVAWFAGTREKNPDVGIRVSRQVDGKWTPSIEVVNGYQSEELRYPTWNPVLFQPKGGALILFYKVGPDPRQWWGMKMTSGDNGKTWSKPTKLGESKAIGHLLGPVKNKPIQLSDGTILCPSSTEVDQAEGGAIWRVHFERTSDLGKTWDVIGPIHGGEKFHAIQPSILTHGDGRLQILCRSREKRIVQSWSSDHGKTWSKMTATSLPNPNSGTDAVTLADGRHLLVYNHTEGGFEGNKPRYMLNVAISVDGEDWKPVMTLERESVHPPKKPEDRHHWGEYSYPAVIQAADGMVHATYTHNREGVKHVVIDPSKL